MATCLWSSACGATPADAANGTQGSLAMECSGAVQADQTVAGGAPSYNLSMSILADGDQLDDGETITIARADGSGAMTQACSSPVIHMNLAPGGYLMMVDVGGVDKAFMFGMGPSEPLRKIVLFFTPGTDA